MKLTPYAITVRGPLPPDLAERVAEVHATAIKSAKERPAVATAGGRENADGGGAPI